jgi:hypothetical protein
MADDDELEAAAVRIAALNDDLAERPRTKLPQARHYLRAARWGFDQMVKRRHIGSAFVFHNVGILTMLRSVPFALYHRDRTLSPAHEAVIGEWWALTQPTTTPFLFFLKRARDIALHEGALNSIAVKSEGRTGEGRNAIVHSRDYAVDLIDGDERHDLLAKLREIFDWFEAQLSRIEAQLPDD